MDVSREEANARQNARVKSRLECIQSEEKEKWQSEVHSPGMPGKVSAVSKYVYQVK